MNGAISNAELLKGLNVFTKIVGNAPIIKILKVKQRMNKNDIPN